MQEVSPGARGYRPNVPWVVILGGGFGGLHAARAPRHAPVRVMLVDRRNHHLFQPLLYQVATATLNPSDTASPIRSLAFHSATRTRGASPRSGGAPPWGSCSARFQLSGLLAWLAWLVIHIYFLMGFRNRLLVMFHWAYSYLTYRRGARLITGLTRPRMLEARERRLAETA